MKCVSCSGPFICGEVMGLGHNNFLYNYRFPEVFYATLAYIELIFGMRVYLHDLQMKFEICYGPLIFDKVSGLGFRFFSTITVLRIL